MLPLLQDGAGQKSVQKTNKLLASKSAVTTDEEYKMVRLEDIVSTLFCAGCMACAWRKSYGT